MKNAIADELQLLSNPQKATLLMAYFKTGKGGYGADDIFLGITVPDQREVAKKHIDTPLSELTDLISSPIHEHRLTALLILTYKTKNASEDMKKELYDFYIKNKQYVNNWDLVDVSAPLIVGEYLKDKDKTILYKLAKSENLWDRRIAILSTYTFIKNKQFKDTLKISEILLHDSHDLIHKAVGWMLRELGKRDLQTEITFLDIHYKTMPRTMLRYSIEKFIPEQRTHYLLK